MISYSQNFEDVMLWRALGHIPNGFYIDIGAHDPESGSVTKAFYDTGWCGINLEPLPTPFSNLELNRSRDINLQLCAGSYNGSVGLYDVEPSGLATIKQDIAEKYIEDGYKVTLHDIGIKKLTSICERYIQGDIHFLKIDVEGAEKDVLLGADFKRYRPWIVIIEATYPNSNIATHSEWEDIIIGSGYEFVYFDGLNRFYVANEKSHLASHFKIPPNFFDSFTLSLTSFFARDIAAELAALKSKTQEAKESREEIAAKARELEVKNKATSTELATYKAKAQEAVAGTKKLELELSKARDTCDAHKTHESLLNSQLKKAQENERKAKANIRKMEINNELLRSELNNANEKVNEQSKSTHEWWSIAEERDKRLAEIHDSWSWHITWPLRKAFDLFIIVPDLPSMLKRKFIRSSSNIVRHILVRAIPFVLNNQRLKSLAASCLNKLPRLASYIEKFAISEGVLPLNTHTNTQTNTDETINNLTTREHEIFIALKTRIATQHRD